MFKECVRFSHTLPNQKAVLDALAKSENLRVDGRKADMCRPLVLNLKRHEGASSAEVWIGQTRALAEVTGELVQPFLDRPAEGFLHFSVEFSPMASEQFEQSRPSVEAIEITRILERAVHDSQALDTEALCVINAERVWAIRVNVTILDDDGNLIDASVLAAMAALQHFRRPDVSITQTGGESGHTVVKVHHSDDKPTTPLPLHHVPIVVTFALMQPHGEDSPESEVCCFLDPSDREEAVMKGRVSFSVNAHKEICSMHKLGGSPVSSKFIIQLADRAITRTSDIHVWLSNELKTADKKAQAERTSRLRGTEFKGNTTLAGKAMEESKEAAAIQHLGYNQLNISCATKDDQTPQVQSKKQKIESGSSSEEEVEDSTEVLVSDFA